MTKKKPLLKPVFGAMLLVPILWSARVGLTKPQQAPARANKEKENAQKLFEGYAKSAGFDYFVGEHLNSQLRLKNNDLVWSTWFMGGSSNMARQSFLNGAGKATTCRNVYNWAVQASHQLQLTGEQRESLKKLLPDLPPSKLHPPLQNLLVLSFRSKNRWVTRTYDRKSLPEAVTRIYELMGAPLK